MFKGLSGMGDMAKMMKAAQDMQTRMTELQEQLAQIEVVGESGGGLVKAYASAKGDLKRLDIDPTILVASEKEVVEDLIVAAIRDATDKGTQRMQAEMGNMAQAMGLPPDFKLPF